MNAKPTGLTRAIIGLIHLYQNTSPSRIPRCRYIPSCSHYAAEALTEHGGLRGSWLALRRVSRCQPFGSFGFDPVPPKSDAASESKIDRKTLNA